MILAALFGLIAIAAWLYLLVARGGFWRVRLETAPPLRRAPSVVAVVPARNEAEGIGRTVRSLLAQDYPGSFSIIVVDDHSHDGTADIAREAAAGAAERLEIVPGAALQPGWTGKLWAVSQGLERVPAGAEYVLLTDGDIEHDAANLRELVATAETRDLDLVSLMVRLRCTNFVERALVPAFVYFFAMLFPFAWVGDARRATAAAAGGCMLVRRAALERIGGIAAIRGALIDDCALAAAVKRGGKIALALSDGTHSLRPYESLGDIWRMIARSAYTQLDHSPVVLGATVVGLGVVFMAPPLLVLAGGVATCLGLAAWALMSASFAPMLRFYRLSPAWAPALPAIALFYLAATLDSARRHWQGKGGEWKGRVQSRPA